MADYLTISANPQYNSVYKRLKPGERRPVENFNGERYLNAVRGKKSLSIITQKLNPRFPATLTRVMENFGTEENPLLVDVRAELSGPKGDMIVYIDKAKSKKEGLRVVFISSQNERGPKVEMKKYRSFADMRRNRKVMNFIKQIFKLK